MRASPRIQRSLVILACLGLLAACGPSAAESARTPTATPATTAAAAPTRPPTTAPTVAPRRTLPPTPGPTATPNAVAAAVTIRFATDGDEIDGWFWLRDAEGAARAIWVFEPIGPGDLVLDFNVLATDGVNGLRGVDARFWLSYGSTTDPNPPADARLVSLLNTSTRDDPVGYTNTGTITIDRHTLPAETTAVWVRIGRTDQQGSGLVPTHIAVAGGSIVLRDADAEAIPLPTPAPMPAPSTAPAPTSSVAPAPPLPEFTTDGDYISGWYWLRDRAGTDRALWTFRSLPAGDITLDLYLLATDRVSGGPGVEAELWLSYGAVDPAGGGTVGELIEEAYIRLPNVSPPGDPVGYTTRGQFTIARSMVPTGTTALWVKVTRSDRNGANVLSTHLAVNAESVTISGAGGGASPSPGTSAQPSATATAQPTPTATPGDGPGRGTSTIVSVGDSYIAGEGGRWAGNINLVGLLDSDDIDALGSDAYFDKPDNSGEEIPGCHRSESAEIHIGDNPYGPVVVSKNLACSGAETLTSPTDPGDTSDYKPGLDAFGDIDGNLVTDEATAAGARISQAVALRQYAAKHNVKMVLVSIGGNNFGFGDVVTQCVEDFLFSSYYWKDYCHDDAIADNFNAANTALRTTEIRTALHNVHDAMVGAGYTDSMWTMVVQTYPAPIPTGGAIRYVESGFTRQTVGGCGFWNADADWAVNTVLPVVNKAVKDAVAGLPFTNVRVMDISSAFNGRRLCENTVGTLNDEDLDSWRDAGAVDNTEWIAPIRGIWNDDNVGGSSPYQKQESFHPNYWGQMALRNCVRQVYNNGNVRGGTCVIDQPGLNDRGEPYLRLNY